MKILVSGIAGFIGFHTGRRLLLEGHDVIGLDSVNAYYDPTLKRARLKELDEAAKEVSGNYQFHELNIANSDRLFAAAGDDGFDAVIHLAAQPGVRYSLEAPHSYIESNVVAFGNVLELCRRIGRPHLIFAS